MYFITKLWEVEKNSGYRHAHGDIYFIFPVLFQNVGNKIINEIVYNLLSINHNMRKTKVYLRME